MKCCTDDVAYTCRCFTRSILRLQVDTRSRLVQSYRFVQPRPATLSENLIIFLNDNLGCFAIPVVLGKIIARLVAMHTRVATPPVVVEKIPEKIVVHVPVPGPPVMVEPVMVPVAGVPMMPPNEGHDLNDSEGDLSASPSRSSSGDSEFLAAWGPMAFGELQDADEHDEHDVDEV